MELDQPIIEECADKAQIDSLPQNNLPVIEKQPNIISTPSEAAITTNGSSIVKTTETEKGNRTRLSRTASSLQTLAQKNKELKMKVQSQSKLTSLPPISGPHLEESVSSNKISSIKRETEESDSDDRAKRQRQQFQPFQSPSVIPPLPISKSKEKEKDKEKDKDKVVIYKNGDYLAVRNESNSFFICRAKQNIFLQARKIKIQWYSNDEDPLAFVADFYDFIDFECILTNIRVNKLGKKRVVSLPDEEKQRIMNILERAINKEKGINEPFDPTKVLSDGLDISILDKEKEIMENIKVAKRNNNESINGKPTNSKSNDETNNDSDTEECDSNPEIEINETMETKQGLAAKPMPRKGRFTKKIKPPSSVKTSSIPKEIGQKRSKLKKISPMYDNITAPASTGDTNNPQNEISIKLNDYPRSDTSDEQSEDRDLLYDSKGDFHFVSNYVQSKLLIRSVIHNDNGQLSSLLREHSGSICSVTVPRSVCIKKNAIHYAIANEDFVSLNILMKASNLAKFPQLIHSTEMQHSELMLDEDSYKSDNCNGRLSSSYAKFALKNHVSPDFIRKAQSHFEDNLNVFVENFLIAVRTGDYDLFHFLAREMIEKCESCTFNKKHSFLLERKPLPSVNRGILSECTLSAQKVHPLHFAAISPDPHMFFSIVDNSLDKLYSADIDGWMPIHYASVCSSFFNLQFLLNLGVPTYVTDSKGNTPLHLATTYNRFENIALILSNELAHSSSSFSLKSYNQKGLTPIHIACKKGLLNVIKFFLENKAEINVLSSNNSGELTPLMIASQCGHLKVVELLIQSGANVNCCDKKNRNPLFHAVMNGHTNVVNTLLNNGAIASCKDILGNNLFHYALAYGWYHCFEILLKATVNPKDTNTFGLTPICAAFMKGHVALIEEILKRNILGINVPVNDLGINLVMLTFSLYPNEDLILNLRLFVEKFKCDLSKTDYTGNNALHYLLQCEAKYKSKNSTSIDNILNEALALLLKHGCDPFHENNAGISPILFALKNDCFATFKYLFKDYNRLSKFQQIIAGNDLLWPLIISHLLDPIESYTGEVTFAKYFVNVLSQNKNIFTVFRNLAFKTNKSGDVPLEYFIKSSKQIIAKSNKHFSLDVVNLSLCDFLAAIMDCYDQRFIQSISILSLAAKYSTPPIIEKLAFTFSNFIDYRTPLSKNCAAIATAIETNNISNARTLLRGVAPELDLNEVKVRRELSIFMFHLKYNNCYDFALDLLRGADPNEVDAELNTGLHLVCRDTTDDQHSRQLIQALLAKGVDINAQNKFGQTALHVALSLNHISQKLSSIFDIFLQNGINLYLKDRCGNTALHYLFKPCADQVVIIRILQLIDTKKYELKSFVNKSGENLLHCCVKAGNSACLSRLKSMIDINQPDGSGVTPLTLACSAKNKDCALILLLSDVDVLRNHFYFSENNKNNLFKIIYNNGWIDILIEMMEKAKSSNRLVDFITQLLRSKCIELAITSYKLLINTQTAEESYKIKLLIEFSKFTTIDVDKTHQVEFFTLFNDEDINNVLVKIFLNSLVNWNYILCGEILRRFPLNQIITSLQQEKISKNLISLVFRKLLEEDDICEEMKNFIVLFINEEININSLAHYPITENGQRYKRYSFGDASEKNIESSIQYSPLIVAVVAEKHNLVKWMLSIKHKGKVAVDVNFADSNQRTPIMHAIFNNDLKMIKLLMDRNYVAEDDATCWLDLKSTFSNRNDVDLLARSATQQTLFHYLVLPFDYFNYSKSDLVFNFLWHMVNDNHKTDVLIDELHKLAVDNHVSNIVNLLETFAPRKIIIRPVTKKNEIVKKAVYNFASDYDIHLNQCSRIQKSHELIRPDILLDDELRMPYDVTFTKLDSQLGHSNYNYNFYHMRIIAGVERYILTIRCGRVGTVGNLKKTYYSTRQEATSEFERIFYLKSGNKWCLDQFRPNQDKYRIVDTHKRSKLTTFNLDINLDQLVTIKSKLSIDLRDLIIRWIKCALKCIDECPDHMTLNSPILENCDDILQKIYWHIFKQKSKLLRNKKKKSLKYMSELIDLSEEFYNQIGIYGREFDRLCPIMTLDEYLEKYRHVQHLKNVVFSKELLYCAYKIPDLNSVDYLYDSFNIELENVLIDSEEWNFVHLYLRNSAQFNFKTMSFYRIKPLLDQFDLRNSYLLWYPLTADAIFRTISKCLQTEPLTDPNSNLIYKALKLTNKLTKEYFKDSEHIGYLLLCEAKLDNILEISPTDAVNQSLLQSKDAIVLTESPTNLDYLQHYLLWRGFIVPFRNRNSTGPTDFRILDIKQVFPRYLIEFKLT